MFNGDCRDMLRVLPDGFSALALASPPYFQGKSYDTSRSIADFETLHRQILPNLVRQLAVGGSICWQVGNHVYNSEVTPLDFVTHNVFSGNSILKLRNRIVWTFGHGAHARTRFSGRHETVLWYTKGDDYRFDLDAVRVKQKYRGKKYYKGPKKGTWSSNPKGKNPGDVWDIPNVKSNHPEKTIHPCQFPVALAQRLIVALTKIDQIVFDPFAGVASTGIAAAITGRRFIGCDTSLAFCEIAERRYAEFLTDKIKIRPLDKPIYQPDPRSEVASDPFAVGGLPLNES
jgi:adenine-specific DNA-methyltransferase